MLHKKYFFGTPLFHSAVCTKSRDYGRPMKPFYIEIPNFRVAADNLGRYILGHFGYFQLIYQHPFCFCESFVQLINHYFYKKQIWVAKNQGFIHGLSVVRGWVRNDRIGANQPFILHLDF